MSSTIITNISDNIAKYWVRAPGLSVHFRRLRMLQDLLPAQQLLLALLRSDKPAFQRVCQNVPNVCALFDECLSLIESAGLGNSVFENLIEVEILSDVAPDVASNVLAKLGALSRLNSAACYSVQAQFDKLLGLVSEFTDEILWIKGISLALSIYAQPELRQFGDFDVVVNPASVKQVVNLLTSNGFEPFVSAASTNQLDAGPSQSLDALFIAPSADWVPTSVLTLHKAGWPVIDIKIGPLDRGVQALELKRFFAESDRLNFRGKMYLSPNRADHLMIVLQNFAKDGFVSWKTLYDINLICKRMTESDWRKFANCCERESICEMARIGLSLAIDRLSAPVPVEILTQLKKREVALGRFTTFTVNCSFVWNSTSLFMMVLNALTSEDRERKCEMLARAIFPSKSFLLDYYGRNSVNNYFLLVAVHWLTMLLPAGAVRRSFGKAYWKSQ